MRFVGYDSVQTPWLVCNRFQSQTMAQNYRPGKSYRVKLGLPICLTDSFVFTLGHCQKLKAMRYESASLNRILADKSHRITLALYQS